MVRVLKDRSSITHSDNIIEELAAALNIPIFDRELHEVTVVDFSKLTEYSSYGYFICEDQSGARYFVINDPHLLENSEIIEQYNQYKIILIKKRDFYDALERSFSKLNTQKALLELGFIDSKATARSVNYPIILIKTFSIMLLIGYLSNTIFLAINYIIYLSQTLFKTWLFVDTAITMKQASINTKPKYYPIYSILIPMYREEYGVKSILDAMEKLDYPRDRLDIKLVVEADDKISLKILSLMTLPEYVHIIKVPYSAPRTKPKALNYAMQYVRGEYVVIYDIEDRPESDQLLKALNIFQNSPKNIICVQAKLNFYNRYDGLLSRLFSVEYSSWFNFLLPALDSSKMPLPLGGNSNHFRVCDIRKLGLWDAYNVTEDADLGVRIFINGYRTKVIDSYTMEEAPTKVGNWIYQRARWIKGFIQTFLVYLGQKSEQKDRMSITGKIGIYLFVGFATYSSFIIPWHFVAMYFNLAQSNQFLAILNGYVVILYMYLTASIIIVNDTCNFKHAKLLDYIALIIWPLYFILHIIASYRALWELIVQPFSWNKTEHELSKGEK
jgi:cellulose synthase/poly-beta-1,6-N-acetylglucosamine synthase-like glycosyltransferase